VELVTATWLYPQTLSRPFSCCRIVCCTAAADEENFFSWARREEYKNIYTGGGLNHRPDDEEHIQQITGFFRVAFFKNATRIAENEEEEKIKRTKMFERIKCRVVTVTIP
jgi:hypothetical protein